jgi:hypothetical protein
MADDGTQHPEGPRTFATALRDASPLAPELLERMLALESGRHPELSVLRVALGLDLDLRGANAVADAALPLLDIAATDAEVARVIDAMHAAVRSSRLVRVAVSDAGVAPSRDAGPIVLRDGEPLALYILAENTTGEGMRFSCEAHGEGIGGFVEPQRAGSSIFRLDAIHTGSYLLPLLVTAGGRPAHIDLPIECRAAGTLAVRIVDDETGEPVAARVYLADDAGPTWPGGAPIRRDGRGDAWFHADGAFEAIVSGTAHLRVARGIEYEPATATAAVRPDGRAEVTVRLRRWSHMAADGWHSGDVHVHLHYGGEYELSPEDASLAQRAEDARFLNMMVANQGSGWVHDATLFSGAQHPLSTAGHVLQWGEEYRNDFYGHLCMYGLRELVPPVYSGFARTDHPHDVPANAVAARHCHSVGGTLSYAHPLFDSGDLDRVFSEKIAYEAKELPVDAALGLVDAIDIMSYPADSVETARLWYRLLNCGLRLAATAGSDTFMNTCDWGKFSNPPAGVRAFVRVDGALSTESWCAGVRAGRSFVTNAPMLRLEIGEHGIGDEIAAAPGDVLRVEAEAGSYAPMDRIELIVDGEVVVSAAADEGGRHAMLSHDLRVERGCWIALRATGPEHEYVLGGALFAHTSPIYVSVPGAPIVSAADAAYFVAWIDRLVAMCEREGSYASAADRGAVVAVFRQAQRYYVTRA